jgi:hypothetical protein
MPNAKKVKQAVFNVLIPAPFSRSLRVNCSSYLQEMLYKRKKNWFIVVIFTRNKVNSFRQAEYT